MSYSEAMVEQLLPSVWDRTYAWGVQNPTVPDPDMPKAKYKSPKEATTFWTHLIDVRMAWDRAPLTMYERRAILLRYAFGWEQDEIAFNQSVSQSTVSRRITKGVDLLTRWLNADYEDISVLVTANEVEGK